MRIAQRLQLVDPALDLVARLALDIRRADEYAGDGAAIEQRLQFGSAAIADQEMPAEPFKLRGIGRQYGRALVLKTQFECRGGAEGD